jgi:hypothetical protein
VGQSTTGIVSSWLTRESIVGIELAKTWNVSGHHAAQKNRGIFLAVNTVIIEVVA